MNRLHLGIHLIVIYLANFREGVGKCMHAVQDSMILKREGENVYSGSAAYISCMLLDWI